MATRIIGFDLPETILDDPYINKTQVVQLADGVYKITATYIAASQEIRFLVVDNAMNHDVLSGPTIGAWNDHFRILLIRGGDTLEILAQTPEFPRVISHEEWLNALAQGADIIAISYP